MRITAAAVLAVAVAAPAFSQPVQEPRSGVPFADKVGNMSLLGVALRTKTMLKVKVYACGLYVADSALAGSLAAYKGKPASKELYRELVSGDFEKQITMKFTRDLSSDQIQGGFRESLSSANADASKSNLFVQYFNDVKSGQEATIHWVPPGTLEVNVAGLGKPPIPDRKFAEAVLSIWLGDKPVQDDIKRDLVSRFAPAK